MARNRVYLVPTLTIGSAVAEDGRREKLPAYGVRKSLAGGTPAREPPVGGRPGRPGRARHRRLVGRGDAARPE